MRINHSVAVLAVVSLAATGCGGNQKQVPLPTETPRQAPAKSVEQIVSDRYIAFYATENPTYSGASDQIRPFYSEWGTGKYLDGLVSGTIQARRSNKVPRGTIDVRVSRVTVTGKSAVVDACLDFGNYRIVNSKTGKTITGPIKGVRPVKVTLKEGGDEKWRIDSEAPASHSC